MRRDAVVVGTILIVAGLSGGRVIAGSAGNGHMPRPPAPVSHDAPTAQSLDSGALKIQADPVAPAAEDQSPQRIVVSPDGMHIAFVSTRGSRFAVVVDGKPSGKYDEIGHLNNAVNREIVFSADGQHVMYIARRSDDQMVVVDGQELVGYQLVDQFSFSPDGKQNAFVGQHDTQNAHQLAVVNGKDSPFYVTVTDLQFSANSAHVAYVGTVADPAKPENTSVVMDGKSEKAFYHVHDFHFSADGSHWAYVGEDFTGNVPAGTSVQEAHLMVDGKELGAYEEIYNCQISADGHVGYTANKRSHQGTPSEGMLTDQCGGLDGQVWDVAKGHRFPANGASPVYLSPDGQHVAWLEERPGNNELSLTVNGKHGLGYQGIQNILFSPDSQHINYVARQNANGNYVVRDEDESGPYAPVPVIYLSPNSKHVAVEVASSDTAFVVEDGKQQATYQAIYGPLVFSPDGEHLAYLAQAKDPTANMTPIQRQQAQQSPSYSRGQFVVLDGQQQPVLPSVKFGSAANHSALHFSPDSKHLAYTDDISKVVIDGKMASRSPQGQHGAVMNGLENTFRFTPDSKHAVWAQPVQTTSGNQTVHYFIDGDEVAGYQLATNVGVPNYQPVLQPDGNVLFFATKDSDTRGMPVSPALYRVTVNPGPERDFGITAAAAAAPDKEPAATSTPPAAQNPQQPQADPTQTAKQKADHATDDVNKAKNAAGKLRGLFRH